MQLPVIRGRIDRRLLINYRASPEIVRSLLPRPFHPQLVGGHAIVGLCLIRLQQVRPAGWPAWLGIGSENAAHRIAIEWLEQDKLRTGVYIFRRDTSSTLNAWAGGRIFPGCHHRSAFAVQEGSERWQVGLASSDRSTRVSVEAREGHSWPGDSVFASLAEASRFFECSPCGFSPAAGSEGRCEVLELRCQTWQAEPLLLDCVRSSYFDDERIFPPGEIALDSGLIMRGIEHEWHDLGTLATTQARGGYATAASSSGRHAVTTS